jgi:hypothetical protein
METAFKMIGPIADHQDEKDERYRHQLILADIENKKILNPRKVADTPR